ncbi:unnamed protein product [Cyprideis torosa]|uniref:receptor protein-tyrosine kinase n=1 Tax=Cyprideis torosa TaxID=163714 RepID=A0A7R8WAE9_9CRUS|nr:unnamed protein product [Cyprideis torosa]CAG0888322.1 unnamed protein product [Cyprideis torosa]
MSLVSSFLTVCPVGRYNPKEGLTPCIPCPPHSSAPTPGLSECVCDTGYYRAPTDPRDTPCTRPPSAPQNLTVNFVDQSTVILSWNPPFNNGGRRDVVFRVRCDACKPGVTFNPDQFRYDAHNETTVTISGLQPVTTYRFQVFAENGVSDQGGPPKDVDLTVTTEAQVSSMVRDVRVVDIKSNEMELAWDPPVEPYGVDVELYEVRYFVRGQENNSSSVLTTQERSSFPNLTQRTEYGFQVRTKTTHGWGEFSPPVYKTTGHVLAAYVDSVESTEVRLIIGITATVVVIAILGVICGVVVWRTKSNDDCNKKGVPSDCDTLEYRNGEAAYVDSVESTEVRLIIGITATVVVIAILGVICGVVVWRTKSNDDCNKKGVPSDCDTLEYRNGEVHAPLETPPIMASHTSTMTTPLFTQMGPPRTYVDPHTYEDPSLAVKDFAREIDASCINIEAIIGGGEFGDVCRGKLKYPGRPEITVAIKTLKPGSSDRAKRDFLSEASSMGQFEHPNVIYLQGVVTKSTPHMIITEFMENGSLDAFLRANDGKFQTMQLSAMLRGIASGMAYLSEMNYVHRDLAARNVLVNAQLVCKIADFGLSREVESTTEGAYTTRGGKIPVRWTAPEAIAFRKFTWASDVWSFGIVSWEVMSYGERPYWNWSNQDVIKAIERGYRLPAPMDCPEAIHQLMLDCWQKERTHRPSFPAIVQTLDRLIRCPETLRKVAPNRPHHNPLAPDVPDLTQIGSVPEWLDSLKMSRYAQSFERAGITCMDHVARLSLQDLQVMGITLVGHQKKILNSVQTMRAQISLNMSDGFLV